MDFKKEVEKLLKKHVDNVMLEIPKNNFGDYAFPCFDEAKRLKKNPNEIAKELSKKIKADFIEKIEVVGPYINFFVKKEVLADEVIDKILKEGDKYGSGLKRKEKVLIESPGPNTNKPLHLGHLRNILLGSSMQNILRFYGKDARIVNVVNDRGVHICKSMWAYMKFGDDKTPESEKMKPDHFVGDYYVRYAKEEKKNPEIEKEIQEMLVKWENGDKKTLALWKKMNKWALDGYAETYKRLNFKIEQEYLESDTYKHGREIILDGLKKGIFEKDETGAIIIDLEKKDLDKKVLLRANGTSVYITQDIYLAKKRYDDFKFDEMVYVVGNEQEYHFKVLFEIFKALKWAFGGKCRHFSYGMVELPEGKMKSREGNVVDTDELLDEMLKLSYDEVNARYPDLDKKEKAKRAEAIAMAAVRFFFLKFDPLRNFVFNPKESLAFEGETGPYLLYSYARASSILRKTKGSKTKAKQTSISEKEKELIKKLNEFPGKVKEAAENLDTSAIATYAHKLSQTFNEFYHNCKVIGAEEEGFRLKLVEAFRITLRNALNLLGMDVIEEM